MKTEILHEDKDVLVVYKPAGLAAQTTKIGQPDVASELKNYLCRKGGDTVRQGTPYLGIVHRLDQPVEGLMVFAKNKRVAASLSGQLQKQEGGGTFHKSYYAVLCGIPCEEERELVDFLYKSQENRAVVADQNRVAEAKKAVLWYRILQVERTSLSLADIRIQTGRFHQIRAQMAHAGFPLLGDFKYGNAESQALSQKLGIRGAALCAYSIAFLHPVSGKKMHFEAKPRGRAFSLFSQS